MARFAIMNYRTCVEFIFLLYMTLTTTAGIPGNHLSVIQILSNLNKAIS